MQRDAQIRACLTTKRLSVLSETVEVHPADGSAAAAQAADLVRTQLAGLVGSAAGIVTGALDALAMGFSVGELIWDLDGALCQVTWHDPRRFAFHGDLYGDVAEVEVLDAALRFPRSHFVVYTYGGKYGNPYGESDLTAAYRSWTEKDIVRREWLVALAKFGSPVPIARVPISYDQAAIDALSAQIGNTGVGAALVVQNDVEILDIGAAHLIEPGAGFATNCMYQDAQIARAILGQEMTSGGNSGSGGSSSMAMAVVHLDVQTDWIQALRSDVAESVLTDQVARQIVMMAMGPEAAASVCPSVRFPNLSPDELAARQLVISAMVLGQVVAPGEAWIRSYLGLPEANSA